MFSSTTIIIVLSLLLAPFLLLQAIKWLVAPILVRRNHRMSAHPVWEQTLVEQLTPEMRDFIAAIVGQFSAEGFEVVANVHQPEAMKGVRAVQVLLVHRATGDQALAIATLASLSRTTAFAVKSEFADGTRITTGANPSASIFPGDPKDQPINAAWVRDARTLVEFHRRRLAALGRDRELRIAPAPGAELEQLRREWERETDRYRRAGYQRLDRSGQFWRLTWKGAFLVTWRLTEPLKTQRMRKIELKARRLWVELGMDSWRPPGQADVRAPATTPVHATPTLAPGPALPPDGQLGYESALLEGEVQQAWAGEALTIRLGGVTPGKYASRNWYGLILPCLFLLVVGYMLFQFFRIPPSVLGRRAFWSSMPWMWILLWVALFGFDVWKFVQGVRRCRGTMILTASPAGLWFRNGPATPAEGHLPRDQVEGLIVAMASLGLFRRTHQLLAVVRGPPTRNQVLMIARNKKVLEEVQAAAMQAMGVELPVVPGSVGASVSQAMSPHLPVR